MKRAGEGFMRSFIARIGERVAELLFDHYMRDMIDYYVHRERDHWAQLAEREKLKYAQMEKQFYLMQQMQIDRIMLHPNMTWVGLAESMLTSPPSPPAPPNRTE